jgi:hypothetical protein
MMIFYLQRQFWYVVIETIYIPEPQMIDTFWDKQEAYCLFTFRQDCTTMYLVFT